MARVFINDFEIPRTCSSCSLFDWDDGTYSDTEWYCCAAKGKLDYRNTDALHEKHKGCPLREDGERDLEVMVNGKCVYRTQELKEARMAKDVALRTANILQESKVSFALVTVMERID